MSESTEIESNESTSNTTTTDSTQSENDSKIEPKSNFKSIILEIIRSKTFWRFTVFSLFLINLNAIFRHLDATMPTFLVRCFGSNIPKGTIYSINPFIIIFLAPVISALTTKYQHFDMIKYGGFVTAFSPFFLAFENSIQMTICMVVTLRYHDVCICMYVYALF